MLRAAGKSPLFLLFCAWLICHSTAASNDADRCDAGRRIKLFPPKRPHKAGEVKKAQPDGIIRLTVDKYSTIRYIGRDDYRSTPEVEVKGVPCWEEEIDEDSFNAKLVCLVDQKTPFVIDVNTEFVLVNWDSDDSDDSITWDKSDKYDEDKGEGEKQDLWNFWELTEMEGIIKDDTIIVEVRLWITNMTGVKITPPIDFTDSSKRFNDVALLIEGEKIYVNKGVLAVHSPVFETMFYGELAEKNKDEIELKDVIREEFIELLHVIYPPNTKIKENSAEYLLKLGDRFQMTRVTALVEDFVLASKTISATEKIRMADKYRLIGLQEHCLKKLPNKWHAKIIQKSDIYNDLSDAMKTALSDRILQFDR